MGSEFVLFVSAAIFSIGAVGFVIRKNPLVMFMSVELMLNAVNFLLIGYSSFLKSLDGQIFRAHYHDCGRSGSGRRPRYHFDHFSHPA